jgi:hypothetical protein
MILRHLFWVSHPQKKRTFVGMYVRKKKNRSGSTSVVVVDKSRGNIKYLATIGISSDIDEINLFYRQGLE